MNEPIQLCTQLHWPDSLNPNVDFGIGGYRADGVEMLWKPGQTITIGFMGGTEEAREFTRRHAEHWLKYANIKFLWQPTEGYYHAMVRIGFDPNRGTWSYVGTDSLMIQGDEPTMNLGRLQNSMDTDNEDDARYVVLHEFAHMLGMHHEQNHPGNEIPWDKEAMYAHHLQHNGWTREQVDQTYFSTMPPHPAQTPHDPQSIMHYPVDNRFTIGDYEIGYNYHPSEGDAEFMRRAYPAPIPVTLRPSQA